MFLSFFEKKNNHGLLQKRMDRGKGETDLPTMETTVITNCSTPENVSLEPTQNVFIPSLAEDLKNQRINRRQSPRYQKTLHVFYFNRKNQEHRYTGNLSKTGMFVRSKNAPPRGNQIEFILSAMPPGYPQPIEFVRVVGQVVWVLEEVGFGVRLLNSYHHKMLPLAFATKKNAATAVVEMDNILYSSFDPKATNCSVSVDKVACNLLTNTDCKNSNPSEPKLAVGHEPEPCPMHQASNALSQIVLRLQSILRSHKISVLPTKEFLLQKHIVALLLGAMLLGFFIEAQFSRDRQTPSVVDLNQISEVSVKKYSEKPVQVPTQKPREKGVRLDTPFATANNNNPIHFPVFSKTKEGWLMSLVTGPDVNIKEFLLRNPSRLVLDFSNASGFTRIQRWLQPTPFLSKVRMAKRKKGLRLVLEFSKKTIPNYQIEKESDLLKVFFVKPSPTDQKSLLAFRPSKNRHL